jgi:hypothetical protein
VVGALALQIVMGGATKFRVDNGHQRVEGFSIAASPTK